MALSKKQREETKEAGRGWIGFVLVIVAIVIVSLLVEQVTVSFTVGQLGLLLILIVGLLCWLGRKPEE